MALIEQYIEFILCPACQGSVAFTSDFQGLRCAQCRRIYPIKDDIPQMIIEEAVVLPDDAPPPLERIG